MWNLLIYGSRYSDIFRKYHVTYSTRLCYLIIYITLFQQAPIHRCNLSLPNLFCHVTMTIWTYMSHSFMQQNWMIHSFDILINHQLFQVTSQINFLLPCNILMLLSTLDRLFDSDDLTLSLLNPLFIPIIICSRWLVFFVSWNMTALLWTTSFWRLDRL